MSETHPEIGQGPAENSADDQGRQLAGVNQDKHTRHSASLQAEIIRRITPESVIVDKLVFLS